MINEKYSFKDFTNKSLKDIPAGDLNDSTIVGSNFYQEGKPDSSIFPARIKNVIFERCNLDNILVPDTCIVIDGTNKRIIPQNDLEDWIVDKNLNPIEPVNKADYIALGISIDPANIPIVKMKEPIMSKKRKELPQVEVI